MKIVEIAGLDNGGHRNQDGIGVVPDGWAVVPEDLPTENFPFGELTAEEIDGVMTVTSWEPLPMPEPEPLPDPDDIPASEAVDIIMGGADDDEG